MKHMFIAAAALAAPMLAAPSVAAQNHAGHPPMAPAPTMAMPFVAKAGAGDLYEIQSSQIALTKTRNAQVRSFANMLIQHHRMTTRDVTAAARRAGLRPGAPMLEPHQRAMIADLRRAPRGSFDRVFLDQQRTAHMEALNLHRTYSQSGDQAELRMAASKAVPIVESHIARIDTISAR